MKKSFVVTASIALSLSALCLFFAQPQPVRGQEAERPQAKQVIEVHELMDLLIDPLYEDLKDAVEVAPEGRKAWRSLYISSYKLAEVDNLLFSREHEEYTTNNDWFTLSAAARDTTAALAASVKERSEYPTIKANYLKVVQSCNNCHERFDGEEPPVIEPPTAWNAAGE